MSFENQIHDEYKLEGHDQQHGSYHQKERFAVALSDFRTEIDNIIPHTEHTAALREKIFEHLVEFQDDFNRLITHHHRHLGSAPITE